MTTRHTPAPWEIEGGPNGSQMLVAHQRDEDGAFTEVVAHVHRADNAALIAAAPDLLEVLEDVVARIDYESGAENAAVAEELLIRTRAAIAKARGQA
jgi:hypothetical protein